MQVGHACLEAGRRFEQPDAGSNLVVLAVPSASDLHRAARRVELWGLRYVLFTEPDDDLGETALCTEPVQDVDRRCFRPFRLWSGRELDLARGPPSESVPASGDGQFK